MPGGNRGRSENRIPSCPAGRLEARRQRHSPPAGAGARLYGSFTDSTAVTVSAVVLCYCENIFCRESQVQNGSTQHTGLSAVHTGVCNHRDDIE